MGFHICGWLDNCREEEVLYWQVSVVIIAGMLFLSETGILCIRDCAFAANVRGAMRGLCLKKRRQNSKCSLISCLISDWMNKGRHIKYTVK